MSSRKKYERIDPPELPAASFETQRGYRRMWNTVGIFQVILQATIGVFRPGPHDPKTWYGRVYRFIGLLCIYAVIAAILVIVTQNFLSGQH